MPFTLGLWPHDCRIDLPRARNESASSLMAPPESSAVPRPQLLGYSTSLNLFDEIRGGIMVRTDLDEAGTVGGEKVVDFALNSPSTVWVCRCDLRAAGTRRRSQPPSQKDRETPRWTTRPEALVSGKRAASILSPRAPMHSHEVPASADSIGEGCCRRVPWHDRHEQSSPGEQTS